MIREIITYRVPGGTLGGIPGGISSKIWKSFEKC